MVEREEHQPKTRTESIALRFSSEDTPRGWETLDEQGLPLTVVGSEEGLVYLFSSNHWDSIQSGLQEANIVYEFKQSPGFTRDSVNNPEDWNSTPPTDEEIRIRAYLESLPMPEINPEAVRRLQEIIHTVNREVFGKDSITPTDQEL